uniref:Uncharacterized protein n=1 Tax=Oryza rufipogon TaxID=4529 RepID=A0A0E0MW60_ORYRU
MLPIRCPSLSPTEHFQDSSASFLADDCFCSATLPFPSFHLRASACMARLSSMRGYMTRLKTK